MELTGKFFMPKATRKLELPVVLPNLYSQVNRVNEETEIYLSLNIKTAIYPTGIFRVVLTNKLNYFCEPIINILKFKIKISCIYMILFLDRKPIFVEHGVKKVTTSLLFCIV